MISFLDRSFGDTTATIDADLLGLSVDIGGGSWGTTLTNEDYYRIAPNDYYFEVEVVEEGLGVAIGMCRILPPFSNSAFIGYSNIGVGYYSDGRVYKNSGTSGFPLYSDGDIIGVKYIVTSTIKEIEFTKNGVFVNKTSFILPDSFYYPAIGYRSNSSGEGDLQIRLYSGEFSHEPANVEPWANSVALSNLNSSKVGLNKTSSQYINDLYSQKDFTSDVTNDQSGYCFLPNTDHEYLSESLKDVIITNDKFKEVCQGEVNLTVGEIVTGSNENEVDPTFTNIISGNVCAEDIPIQARIFAVSLSTGNCYETTSDANGDYQVDTYPDTGFFILVRAQDYGIEFPSQGTIQAGDRIHPTTPNGYVYDALTSGVTSPNEPAPWPTSNTVTSGNVLLKPVLLYRPAGAGYVQGVFQPI